MRFRKTYLLITLLGGVLSAAARLWMLLCAVDDRNLPVSSHPAAIGYFVVLGVVLLLLLALSFKSPGRSGAGQVLVYSAGQTYLAFAGGIGVLLGAIVNIPGGDMSGLLWSVAGICVGSCMLAIAVCCHRGKINPPMRLFLVAYLLIKLIVNFKSWSTDPIILDYFDLLFALCFVLLAFHYSTGFCFNRGMPRRTLFCAAAAVVLSASAAMASVMKGNYSDCCYYLGYLLWLLPVAECVQKPSETVKEPKNSP